MKEFPLLFKTREEALNYGLTYHATPSGHCYLMEVKGGFKVFVRDDHDNDTAMDAIKAEYKNRETA